MRFYRHNGEFRKIRPFGDLPIDLLGIGGLAVAVPSRVVKGEYSFIQGSLDDIDRLPVMRGLDPAMYRPRDTSTVHAAPTVGKVALDGIFEGQRNNALWRFCMQQRLDDLDATIDAARTRNASFAPPMSEEEVIKVAKQAWDYTVSGNNWFGKGKVVLSHAEMDELPQDAAWLLGKLRRHNWRGPFIVANAMAESLGWDRHRFTAAKAELESREKIICISHRKGGNRPPTYVWGSK
jgi:hypothetical protein